MSETDEIYELDFEEATTRRSITKSGMRSPGPSAQTLGVGTALPTPFSLHWRTHSSVASAGELDYQERMAEEKSRVPNPQPPDYAPTFEEDQDRP
jgi:hypothetical protein